MLAAGLGFQSTDTALAFVEKPFKKPLIKDISDTAKVDVDAERITFDPKTNIATATGKVALEYGPYRLNATKVVYNLTTKRLTANGSVTLKEPNGNSIEARTLSLDTAFQNGFARHLRALLTNDGTITADYAVRRNGRITVFEKMHYTACRDCETRSGEPLWEIVAERATHDQVKRSIAYQQPRLKIAGATVFGLPYMEMPDPGVKRKSGFLIPNYKYNDYMGLGIIAPYFWAPAPNYDVTLRPMFTTYQGLVADAEWRHRLKSGIYSVRGMGVAQLNPRNNPNDREDVRGAIATKGRFALNSDWRWGWDGTVTSDKTFLRRYSFGYEKIAYNDLFVTGLWDQTYVNAQAQQFSPLDSDIDWDTLPVALPYVTAEHVIPDTVLGGELALKFNAYSLHRDQASVPFQDVNHGTDQSRINASAQWKNELIFGGGQVLKSFASLRNDFYLTENVPGSGSDSTETFMSLRPAAGIDLRWPLLATSGLGQSIVSPVMQIIASDDISDGKRPGNEDSITLNFDHSSLFLEDRSTGLDHYETGVRANIGLTYDFLHAGGSFARASIGESLHLLGSNSFADGSGLDGSQSDLVAALTISPWEGYSLFYEGRMEEDLSRFNRHEAGLGLSFDRFSGYASYLYIDKEPAYGRNVTEEFIQANARYGISDGWYVFGDANFDLEHDFFRSRGLGLEFDCDCMNARLAYAMLKSSRDDKTDHRLTLSVNLATIGGSSVSTRF